MINYLYLDIETIPSQSPEVHEEIAKSITPPGSMKKAETIEKWEKEQKPQAVKEAIAKTSFDGALGHVCCVSFAVNHHPTKYLSMRSVETEKSMLESVFVNLMQLADIHPH